MQGVLCNVLRISDGFAVGLGSGLHLEFGCGWFLCMAGFGWGGDALAALFEYEKGIGWMPWRQEAMKDVARCENLGGAASEL